LRRSTHIFPFLKAVFLGGLFLLLSACNDARGKVMAEVDGEKLYMDDLIQYMQLERLSPDNPREVEFFVERWIQQEMIRSEMQRNHPEIYRKNNWSSRETLYQLNLFELENIYINEKLDTIVTDQEIMHYYRQNKDNYLDKSFIVKALYIKIPDSIPATKSIEKHFLLKKDKDRDEILRIGNLYATNFYFEEEKWIFFEDLARELPIPEGTKERLIVSKGNGIFTENENVYFINILDYRIKSTTAPLAFEIENIKRNILKRRSNALRKEIHEIIINEIEPEHNVIRNH
jgi:hypothetical protein